VLQVLAYPVTDNNFATPSYIAHSDGMPLTSADMKWFFEQYAPLELHDGEDISPLGSTGLGILPSTFILTAEHDVLRSDGQSYAHALESAGVEVTHKQYDGMTHGFLRLHNHLDVSREALSDIAGAIRRATGAPS
jgi:acetyl esterase